MVAQDLQKRPVSHQRSVSLVDQRTDAFLTAQTMEKKDEVPGRPRGMSLPHGPPEPPKQRRRGMSFLHLNIPDTGWSSGVATGGLTAIYNQLQHLPVPTFSFTGPMAEGNQPGGRKFSFGLRRLSQTTLAKSDSMVSLCFRTIVSYISEENLPGLRSFLDGRKTQVDDRDENNATALIIAAAKGKTEFVRELLRYGADVNAEDADNWTALVCAAKEGHVDVCRELLDHGAAVDHRDMGSWTALLWAAYKGRTEVAELLITRGADVNAHDNYHILPLHWACGRGHTEIAKMLLRKGVKVNVGDKYGTTALIWACRKGCTEVVGLLLKHGAGVDTAGMYSWTPLLVATAGNFPDIVSLLLEHKPNVNALDKDGYTALALACKDGYYEIAVALISVGAYINLQDRSGDTNLIHAVKGGHRNIVEALLKKYADVDIPGKDKKTAIYTAVEKGNAAIVKVLLGSNPDLEMTTKDGDTALLRAVRSRNSEMVQMLLDKKAKVTATDKKGDTVLHIAMRARSKAIVEILLRNPKNSQLLYRPNKAGETPYNLDIYHQKTILGQIFGARRLNTNEDNENMLGYDLYSSALADILSEPSLSMPIIVGLFAKWGSGKSFLLNKLREEMKNFAREWVDPSFRISGLVFLTVSHFALVCAVAVGLAVNSWVGGLALGLLIIVLTITFLACLWCCANRYDWNWPYQTSVDLARRMNSLRLILQVMFCHPPGAQQSDDTHAQPIRFNFTDQTRISSTTGGENSVVLMLGSLYESIETDYGSVTTRLFRAFRPRSLKPTTNWRWRRMCCLPYVVIFEAAFALLLVEVCLLAVYFGSYERLIPFEDMTLKVLIISIGTLLAMALVANTYTIGNMVTSLVFSQRKHLQRTIARLDTLKSEGFLQALRSEVTLMVDMVKCLDRFTQQQTRLVIVVDGLDSCEQDKVLMVLDAIHMLFSDANAPFIVILAIDPHIISKAVELNSRRVISESNIGGHEYLRSLVHLPFFLANSALRKVKVAQSSASRRSTILTDEPTLAPSMSSRRLSVESNFNVSTEKLKLPSRKGSRKLKLSESIASSIGSNLNRIGGAQDLTKMLLTDDYFSDVNPRSMRRLLNVVYVTGRLLKAFQMEFNWYHLAIWVNITEQWPYRTSWIILYYEMCDERLDDQTSLKTIYDEVRPRIPVNKDEEPLLEIDRDERKFDVFLTYHRSSLLLCNLKVFLPFTINLDPYIKKVIKEDLQEEPSRVKLPQPRGVHLPLHNPWLSHADVRPTNFTPTPPGVNRRSMGRFASPHVPHPCYTPPLMIPGIMHSPLSATTSLPPELLETRLSQRNVDGVCELMHCMQEVNPTAEAQYVSVIRSNNINGRVLLHCDMDDLKKVLNMTFGDWEMFKVMIISLREHEVSFVTQTEEAAVKNVRFSVGGKKPGGVGDGRQKRNSESGSVKRGQEEREEKELRRSGSTTSKHSTMESQVTLEDQMICGALQTLNEEACEDVLEENNNVAELDVCDPGDTSVVFLQSSPLNHPYWQATSVSIGEDQISPPSSTCATPILSRRPSRHKINRSRPSSLLLADEHRVTPPASPSFLSSFTSSVKKKKPDVSPTVLITPVPGVEKIQRIKEKILRKPSSGNSEDAGNYSDDEHTPLVSETHTPTHVGSEEPEDKRKADTPPLYEVVSNSGSEASISLILERSKSSESVVSSRSQVCADVHGGSDFDLKVTTTRRSHQTESITDNLANLDWDTPETSV